MIYEARNIVFSYPNSERTVLNNVSLTLEEGEILTILGPNGAGKSTLLNCLAGLLNPDSGEIFLTGKKLSSMDYKEIARIASYVQQTHNPVFPYTVLHFVTMGRAPGIGLFQKPGKKDEKAAWNALELLGISHLAHKSYMEISGGERQQATIARSIVLKPKVILFDEPTAHLDYGNQLKVLRIIKSLANRGFAVVMTTHNPDHPLLLGGSVAVLDKKGYLEKGPYEKIVTEERLNKLYRAKIRLMPVPDSARLTCIPPDL
jgi:iron complex transport system ATP-binding protein